MYAVKSYKEWRFFPEDGILSEGEYLSESIPLPTNDDLFSAYVINVSSHVTAWMSNYVNDTYGYDDIVSASSYAGDKSPKFNAEGTAARDWRSDVFSALYEAMPTYSSMKPDQWPALDYITANLPQPSAYQWEPS